MWQKIVNMSGCEIRHGPENYQKDVHMTYLFLFINLSSLIIGAFGFHQLRPEQKICKLLLEVGSRIKQCTMDINHNNSSISRSCVLLYICLQTFAHWAIKRFRNGGCHAWAGASSRSLPINCHTPKKKKKLKIILVINSNTVVS